MSARATAVSVLPTPLGPTSRKTPIGLPGSVRLAREVRIRWAIASRACAWPITRSSSRSRSESTVWISSATILPTGMPVQPRPPRRSPASRPRPAPAAPPPGASAARSRSLPMPAGELAGLGRRSLLLPWLIDLGLEIEDLLRQRQLPVPALLDLRPLGLEPRQLRVQLLEPAGARPHPPCSAAARWPARARGCRSRAPGGRSRGGSPRPPAAWPSGPRATRAQAVSSRLTALSGSWRPVM